MKYLFFIFFLGSMFLISSCDTVKPITGDSDKPIEIQPITVIQDGKEMTQSGLDQVYSVDRKPFAIRFQNRAYNAESGDWYAAQIALLSRSEELLKAKPLMNKNDVIYFGPGTGMASHRSGMYEVMFMNDEGHHYLFYSNEDEKRVNLVKKSGEELLLEFEVNGIHSDDGNLSFADIEESNLYMAILVDRNLNGTIDEGELVRATFKFR